ncbi:MAG: hypothetical protein U1D30_07400 [Planctomycetota bacterium]
MNLHLATFRFDVTPPKGHPLCGGWIKPVLGVDDPLEAIGIVLLGAGAPIVLCAVDWTGICNATHRAWREALAEAAHTTPDRVAVQCVHQHNAPFVCLEANAIVEAQGDLPPIVDKAYHASCLEKGAAAVREGLSKSRRLTHVAHGMGKVEKVASNRRFLGPDGTVKDWRGSSSADARLRALPEGLIDPMLRTVAFYDGDARIAALHYYATHPMSYYGDGMVSSDFVGLARKRKQNEDPSCTHIYFTGCSGNVAAGKYNDGSHGARPVLADRIYQGILLAEQTLKRMPVEEASWRTHEILPIPRDTLRRQELEAGISNRMNTVVARNRPSFMVSWLDRLDTKFPITLSSLRMNDVSLIHLPSECFIEYQLRAQEIGKDRFVATAAYGDGGPWYIPVETAYPQGGYEVTVAFSDPSIDGQLTEGLRVLLV